MINDRLDKLLVEKGLVDSREKAQRLIRAGKVLVNGKVVDKPGSRVSSDADLKIREPERYVSRGGVKLEFALTRLGLKVDDYIAADIGASTGGFTDCLLQHGTGRVYAIDVGYGQLHWKLRNDQRVIPIERCNARYLRSNSLPELVDLVTIDVSFISLRNIIPAALRILKPAGLLICLVKPQFEAGKGEVPAGGVVRDPKTHKQVLHQILQFALTKGLTPVGACVSPIEGKEGNIEYFMALRRKTAALPANLKDINLDQLTKQAIELRESSHL